MITRGTCAAEDTVILFDNIQQMHTVPSSKGLQAGVLEINNEIHYAK